MSVLDFKGYSLEYFQEGVGSYDENGDYQKDAGVWVSVGKCDAVPAGRNNVIQLPDGTKIAYSFTIYLSSKVREFHYGERLRLKILGRETKELKVVGFARYQHQSKVWA